jgi:AcrR family transcriptional regulator
MRATLAKPRPERTQGNEARRGPGRPARLSRQTILHAAVALLEREPGEPLTVARIAAEVEAVPAALYRHFASLDALLDSVLGAVLRAVEPDIRRRASWPQQVRDWMTSVRDRLLRYPAVLPQLGRRGRTSPAWLDTAAVLVGILERAGLSRAELARTHLCIAETTMGIVMLEASFSLPDQIANARASLADMSAGGRARMAPLLPHLARLDGDAFFAFVADRTLEVLVARAEAHRRR